MRVCTSFYNKGEYMLLLVLLTLLLAIGCTDKGELPPNSGPGGPPNPTGSAPSILPFTTLDTVLYGKTATIKWFGNSPVTITGGNVNVTRGANDTLVVGPLNTTTEFTLTATNTYGTTTAKVKVFVPSERISLFCGTRWKMTQWKSVREYDGHVSYGLPDSCKTTVYKPSFWCYVRIECGTTDPIGTILGPIPWALADNEQTFVSNPAATNRWTIVDISPTRYEIKNTTGVGQNMYTAYLVYTAVPE